VIYEKAVPRPLGGASLSMGHPTRPSRTERDDDDLDDQSSTRARAGDQRQLVLIGAVVASLVVGYVAGREHVKYELRSAMSDAVEGFKRGLAGGPPPPAAKPKVKASKEQPIVGKLVRKGYHEGEYGRGAITFTVDFTNQTGKPVRAFDGVLTFTDLLGNEIYGAKFAINDPIAVGGSYEWDGKLDYNQFISEHERLRNAEPENMKLVLTTKKILFDDGQVKDFGQ